MARSIFDDLAINDNQIVELQSADSAVETFANIHLLFGAMLWPHDRVAFEHMVLGALNGISERTKHINDTILECGYENIPSYMEAAFRKEIRKSFWHGYVAGEAFLMFIQCKFHCFDISIRKAQYLGVENCRGGRQLPNGSFATISEKTMKLSWKRFYNSLHLWAAYIVVNETHEHMSDPKDPHKLLLIAEIANIFSSLVLEKNYMKMAKTPWQPIIFKNTSLTVNDFIVPAPSKEMIQALEDYKAKSKTSTKTNKLIGYAGG